MEKRSILAIALSLLVLIIWSTFNSKVYHVDNKEVVSTSNSPTQNISTPAAPVPLLEAQEVISPSDLFQYTQDKFTLTFIESKAAIQEVKFHDHQDSLLPLKFGFFWDDKNLLFKKENASPQAVSFIHSDPQKVINKKFIFSKSNYGIELEIKIKNLSSFPLKINLPLVLGVMHFAPRDADARYQDATIVTTEKVLHLNPRRDMILENLRFLSLRDRYFCAIVQPESAGYKGVLAKSGAEDAQVGLASGDLLLAPGKQIEEKFHIYLGPQNLQLITSINPDWSQSVHYSFNFIAVLLLQLLEFFYGLVHNWGWAIIILSLAVSLLFYPLTLKQVRSMKEMQLLQPKIEELRKLYKDNPQKMNTEIMGLYREHKVNPLGGCLPLLLQMPIFLVLYQVLMRAVALKGAPFLWIKDLSGPDRLFTLPFSMPVLGNAVNILPILMAIGMFVQQKFSSAASGMGGEQQKMMAVLFPLLFGFIFYQMPAGLVLYWFINSTLMLFLQFSTTRPRLR